MGERRVAALLKAQAYRQQVRAEGIISVLSIAVSLPKQLYVLA